MQAGTPMTAPEDATRCRSGAGSFARSTQTRPLNRALRGAAITEVATMPFIA